MSFLPHAPYQTLSSSPVSGVRGDSEICLGWRRLGNPTVKTNLIQGAQCDRTLSKTAATLRIAVAMAVVVKVIVNDVWMKEKRTKRKVAL